MKPFSGLGNPITFLSSNAFGAHHHPRRLNALFREIRAYEPDVICLQEIISAAQVELVSAAFDADYEIHYLLRNTWPINLVAGGLVTLVRRTRLIVETRQFMPFSWQSTLRSPRTMGDAQLRKGYLVLQIIDGLTGHSFDVYNTHLVARYGQQVTALHRRQLTELEGRIRFTLPQIFCGDLNITPDLIAADSPLRELSETFGLDSGICTVDNERNSLRRGVAARVRGCGGPTLRQRVDYFFHHGFRSGGERLCFTQPAKHDDYQGHVTDHFGIFQPLEFS